MRQRKKKEYVTYVIKTLKLCPINSGMLPGIYIIIYLKDIKYIQIIYNSKSAGEGR